MRALISIALLMNAVKSDDGQFVPEGGKTLEEAYGPMANVDETIPWYERDQRNRRAYPDEYFNVRKEDNCSFPLEVYLVQDETGSFQDNYKQMKDEELKDMFDTLAKNHPGSTFGVGSHRDIPIWPLGEPETDYCWMFHLPLTSNFTALYDTYDKFTSVGGGDAPEYQFGSIIAAAQSNIPGWCDPLAARLLVVSTDSQPHFEDDGFNEPGLKPYAGTFDEANPEEQCLKQYYPSPTHVKTALKKREAYAAFLVFDGEHNQGGKPIDAWKWFNSYIEQSPEFVANVQAGAADFWDQLSKIITEIEKAECLASSSSSSTTTTTTLVTTMTPTTVVPEGTTEAPTTRTTTTTPRPSSSTTTPRPSSSTTTHAPSSSTTTVVPEGTTEAPPTTTTTHPRTTMTPTPMTTTHVTTTTSTHTTTTTTEQECPPCPDKDDCPCPAVKIVLQDKPKWMKLEVNNTVVI